MADRSIKLRELKRILRRYHVEAVEGRGKGSHILFSKAFPDGVFTYPVPNDPDVKVCYVKGCRRRFRLTKEDGITDEEFYQD